MAGIVRWLPVALATPGGRDAARLMADQSGGTGVPAGEVYDWYRRGVELLESGNPEAAAHLLERAQRDEPSSASIREALARALFDAGRYRSAAEAFESLSTTNPDDDYARFGLGLSLARLGEHAAAAEQLALAAAMRPQRRAYTDALRQVRATLRARGDR